MASPSRVQSFGNTTTTTTCSQTATVGAGNFLIAAGYGVAGTATTIADSNGNTWTQQTVAGGFAGYVVYTAPITVGGSDVVTATNTGSAVMSLSVLEVTGQSASPIDPASTSAQGGTTTGNSGATATPASGNELAVGIFVCNATLYGVRSFSPSLTSQTNETPQAGSAGLALISDGPMASAAAETYTVPINSNTGWSCWCLLIQGAVTQPGFFASVGRPGPRVPNNTFRQGGY
jgi:hypothetical protein